VHLSIFISVFNQLYAHQLFHNKFYFMPLHVSSTCAHHQEVKIALHSLWYHHNYKWPFRAQVERGLKYSFEFLPFFPLFSLFFQNISFLNFLKNPMLFVLILSSMQQYTTTRVPSQRVHEMATYRCDDTRGCVMQF